MLFLPLVLLLLWAVASSGGIRLTPLAVAATSTQVNVTGQIGANMAITACGANKAFNVTLGSLGTDQTSYSGACTITFGANNDNTTKFTIEDSDGGTFFVNGGNSIADTAANCSALPAGSDNGGVHVVGLSADVRTNVASWGAGCSTTAGSNDKFKAVPDASTDMCEQYQGAASPTNTCDVEWGVNEYNGDAVSGDYVGVTSFTMVNY